jgi:hypothetical protein
MAMERTMIYVARNKLLPTETGDTFACHGPIASHAGWKGGAQGFRILAGLFADVVGRSAPSGRRLRR